MRVEGHAEWGREQLREAERFLRHGVHLDGVALRPAGARWINEAQLQLTLTEGRHRQIRRMCEALGYRVRKLKRVRIMNIQLGPMPVGAWRPLGRSELRVLRRSLASSSKTHEAPPE